MPAKRKIKDKKLSQLRKFSRALLLGYLILSLGPVLIGRFLPLHPTPVMVGQWFSPGSVKADWVPLKEISPNLSRAVIAAEDANFCKHNGFEFGAIQKAWTRNMKGRRLYGGSTISQQTAKNAFLWHGRSWLRKGLEANYTIWMELLWPKERIMEIYLNVIEFDKGVYGAEAAAQHHFGKSAENLTQQEAARLAAVLPKPKEYSASSPSPYIRRQAGRILGEMKIINSDRMAACVP